MARAKTKSFITEIALKVDSAQEVELLSRFQAARQLYNACLSEAMARMKLVRGSVLYQNAKKIPKRSGAEKAQRNAAFNEARDAYNYSDYALQYYATLIAKKSKWIWSKLGSLEIQTLATRAFRATERVIFGLAKKIRFKVPNSFKSIENKSNKSGLRWVNNTLVWGKKFIIQPIIDEQNDLIMHGLNSTVKYVRLIKRELNGKHRWFVQLINEGEAFKKKENYIIPGIVGIDLNISNVGFVADNFAGLLPFAEHVPTFDKEISKLQRQIERSRRATNPENYESDFQAKIGNKVVTKKGKAIKGKRQLVRSNRYCKAATKKREIERRKAAYTKSQNRRLVNQILRHGHHIKAEKVSVKGWQKIWGKAISAKSPGFFQSELRRKAESAGGVFQTFSTQKTALSQTHLNGERIKKSLSERVHKDNSGFEMHRDLFSAYLSRYVDQEDQLSLPDVQQDYPRMEPFLMEAWEHFKQTANRVGASESRNADHSLEQFFMKLGTDTQISYVGLKGVSNS